MLVAALVGGALGSILGAFVLHRVLEALIQMRPATASDVVRPFVYATSLTVTAASGLAAQAALIAPAPAHIENAANYCSPASALPLSTTVTAR